MWKCLVVISIGLFVRSVSSFLPSGNCSLLANGPTSFPKNFSFGAATSAYQIEGSWNVDGKGLSIWDEFVHKYPDNIKDGTNGDTAAESYRLFDLDLQALIDLKVDHYRFSISWPRIFPTGDISSKNQKGIDYYNSVIDKLLANGIQPMVTIFHYDLPVELQKLGGFTNELFIEQFAVYAEELFMNFGDRVKTWITFNEPVRFCKPGYGSGRDPPNIKAPGIADYICIANIIKSHAVAYRIYRSKYFEKQGGKLGLALDSSFFFSKSNDTELIYRSLQYNLGILAEPIYGKSGQFPQVMIDEIGKRSQHEGRKKSRLPNLGYGKWRHIIHKSADFLGLNYYTSKYIELSATPKGENPSMDRDYAVDETSDSKWLTAKSTWLHCLPEGLEGLLKFIRDEYENVEVIITENGWSDNGELEDDNRILYINSHLQAVLNAKNDGCNVSGYTVWSLLDNFEWGGGYTAKFGFYWIDRNSTNMERIPKKSARYFRQLIEGRKILNV